MEKLKEYVTEDMLEELGFRLVVDYEIRAIRKNVDRSTNTFINHNREVFAWDISDIYDLFEKGYIEEKTNDVD